MPAFSASTNQRVAVLKNNILVLYTARLVILLDLQRKA